MDTHSVEHDGKVEKHSQILDQLGSDLSETNGSVNDVAGHVQKLKMDVKRVEGKMRGELQRRLSNVRSVLLAALDKAGKDISEIRKDVEDGMV